jgi:hypothetical protein
VIRVGEDGVVEATESSSSVEAEPSLLPDGDDDKEPTSSQFPLGLLWVPLGHLAIVIDVGIIIERTRVIIVKEINTYEIFTDVTLHWIYLALILNT